MNHVPATARRLAGLVAIATLQGCAPGNGDGLSVSGRPLSEGGDLPLAPTLESIQANVFDASCIVCHSGAAAPLGLRLDADNSYVSLVGVASREAGSLLRVAPGDPDGSYLVRKLEGTAAEGARMPLGGSPIPQATINFVRQWIIDGALPGLQGAQGEAPVVVSMTPPPDSSGPDFPSQITVGFDRDIDASTINSMTFTLMRSGGDRRFGDAADIAVVAPVKLSEVNARLAIMDLAGAAAVDDLYRVTLKGAGPGVVLDIDGAALDGEYTGMMPSGDGTEGGDFVADFEILGLQSSLDSIQTNLFGPTCSVSGCHSGPAGGSLPQGMDLTSAGTSFTSLVGVPSSENPALQRVAPGDSAASYLVQKLEGSAGVGQRMPAGGEALDATTIDVIRTWIDEGALR